MRLSENFTLAELISSQAAVRLGIRNHPGPVQTENLRQLAVNVLQPLRNMVARPVVITSGYRSPALNRHIGGSTSSQHMLGEAADLKVPGMTVVEVAELIRDRLPFDQLILEHYTAGDPTSGWVHVSYRHGRLRREVLTKRRGRGPYLSGLRP